MRDRLRLGALACLATLVVTPGARAALREDIAADVARTAVHQGLLRQGTQTAADHGDLDGDGRHEGVVAYKIRTPDRTLWGVLVIYQSFEAVYRERSIVAWKGAWPETLGVAMERLEVGLRAGEGEEARGGQEVLRWEKDLDWQRERDGRLRDVKPWASSTLDGRKSRGGKTSAEHLVDDRMDTGWAESALGTGISERVRLSFTGPVDLALLGLAGGNGASDEAFELSNRVGRFELRVLTASDEGDPAAGIDYTAMGLAFSGQKEHFDLRDEPGMVFLPVDVTEVKHLELKIESVFLGDKFDDCWISELVPVRQRPTPALELLNPPKPPPPLTGSGPG
ncbi:MAG: hypothetical protein P1V51_03075 [Deltaproteobacteria bacterium]|nr:hypothetical protein [Deltaproteobacteria bacterium]